MGALGRCRRKGINYVLLMDSNRFGFEDTQNLLSTGFCGLVILLIH